MTDPKLGIVVTLLVFYVFFVMLPLLTVLPV